MRSLPLALLVASLAASLAPRPAAAQLGDVARARSHHEAGVSYFDQGRYLEAAQQFREAYTLSGRSHLLLNVSRALELAGRPGEAADALQEYLAREPNVTSRRTLERRLAELRARSGTGGSGGEGRGGGGGPDLLGPILLLSGAGATAVAAIVTGVVALDLHGSVNEACDPSLRCPPSVQDDIDTGTALALTSDILFGATAALAVAGGVWLIVALADDGASSDVQAGAACTSDGCAAGLSGRF